ncbi:MAG: hypothetical protein Q4G25_08810 [Paracoccus sp. (in: a-proteobacteria)]|nr:hypothetical protein [Paracoccus sp. (in: a-proteobacteria)]
MTDIAPLAPQEAVRFDSGRVQDIVNELGETAAESVIQHALEQMAGAVALLQDATAAGNGHALIAQAERLSRLALQVGLVSLSGVAGDVAICARRGDPVALNATLARVVRIANRSLTEIWDGVGA